MRTLFRHGYPALVLETPSLDVSRLLLFTAMKAITSDMVLTSASTRSDGSLALRFSTPELKPEEKTAFFELINQNLKVLVEPWEVVPEESIKIAEKMDSKTPSQRLRGVLFVLWQQKNKPGEFEEFYRRNVDKLIDFVKGKLQPV